jgi:hypothetical protein
MDDLGAVGGKQHDIADLRLANSFDFFLLRVGQKLGGPAIPRPRCPCGST